MRPSIIHAARAALAIGAAALVVAGCGSDSEDEPGTAAAASSGVVSVASVDGTDVLADAEGRTLYTTTAEEGGEIKCVDACTSFWAPVAASAAQAEQAAADLETDLAVVERPDGEQQLTFNGRPLYSFTDEDAGKLEGDGFEDDFQGTHFLWEAARTAGGSGSQKKSDSPGGAYGY
jgi:predicted lipoprotein with Yx(FWY)xxD motif